MQQPAWRTQPSEGQSSLSEGLRQDPTGRRNVKKALAFKPEGRERALYARPEMNFTDSRGRPVSPSYPCAILDMFCIFSPAGPSDPTCSPPTPSPPCVQQPK